MQWTAVTALAIAAALSSCATDPTWERIVPPSSVVIAANGCPKYRVDDASPLSQWKNVGSFWDQDVCQGTPFQVAEIKGQFDLSREQVRKKAQAGDPDSIEAAQCWEQKGYISWTAPESNSLIRHEWDALPYACVEKDDPRLKAGKGVGTPQVAGN